MPRKQRPTIAGFKIGQGSDSLDSAQLFKTVEEVLDNEPEFNAKDTRPWFIFATYSDGRRPKTVYIWSSSLDDWKCMRDSISTCGILASEMNNYFERTDED